MRGTRAAPTATTGIPTTTTGTTVFGWWWGAAAAIFFTGNATLWVARPAGNARRGHLSGRGEKIARPVPGRLSSNLTGLPRPVWYYNSRRWDFPDLTGFLKPVRSGRCKPDRSSEIGQVLWRPGEYRKAPRPGPGRVPSTLAWGASFPRPDRFSETCQVWRRNVHRTLFLG